MSAAKSNMSPTTAQEEFVKDVISVYPNKVAKKRLKHIVVKSDGENPEIEANVRTAPGIITQRGCCYAGCKGVVIGPIGDMVHIVHGPIGCSFYAWITRRNMFKPREDGANYLNYCFSTDMQDSDVIFGGEKKLRQAIQEACDIFKPKAISVHATCPVGLIGDDIQAVAREMTEKTGTLVIAFNCEGYKGVSQSGGHHIANNKLFEHVVGKDDTNPIEEKFVINVLGEYNIGGDAWEIERVFAKCGIKIISTFSGDASIDEMKRAHQANLNLVMCHRSINYMAEMMETAFGIPWIKVNFIGVNGMAKSLRKVAKYFDDPQLTQKVEDVIAEEESEARKIVSMHRERLQGKTAMLFVGGSRAHHYQELFRDLGMETTVAGFEFAHRDDYEGRHVLSTLKPDADSRNIEEIKVEPDEKRYNPRISPKEMEDMQSDNFLSSYEGMIPDMNQGTMIIDDISHVELEELILRFKPDIVCSGIKDKYIIEKFGVPSKQLHNYDYSGPYAGFRGAVNFARDIDMMINNPAWKLVHAPWDVEPTLRAQTVA